MPPRRNAFDVEDEVALSTAAASAVGAASVPVRASAPLAPPLAPSQPEPPPSAPAPSGAALVAPAEAVFLDAKIESELKDLDPEDAAELLASTGQDESGLDQLARIGFATLGLQTYLTAGPKEARAWTIPQRYACWAKWHGGGAR